MIGRLYFELHERSLQRLRFVRYFEECSVDIGLAFESPNEAGEPAFAIGIRGDLPERAADLLVLAWPGIAAREKVGAFGRLLSDVGGIVPGGPWSCRRRTPAEE